MSFIKNGDAQPILKVLTETDLEDKKTKKALDSAKQNAKNISADGNNMESIKKSD